ncbi:Chitinase 4 [Mucor velutinosus]|uniref:Chitinase 4 n=1 Tax=Mucor velutinosus TaxID=708070 RepID=A0AAN7DAZ1_9FUNG|nr:Chitinase 4 [Mucor velutinosus]
MSKLIKNYFGALEGEMDYASQQTGRGSDDESIIEQDAGDVWSDNSDGTRLTVEPEDEDEDEDADEDKDEDEDEDEDKHSHTESFFMYGSDDEILLRPLFQKVDLLINDFAETNAAFTKDQVKRYLGAHVCYEHHTKFIGEFKPPQAIKAKLSGWSMYQKEHTQGKKILKSERKAHLQQLGAQWKALSAEQQRPYKLEAEEEKKRSSNIDMLAKYKSFDRHWKQFRRSADFFRENYRTHLMIYRATDTIYDKLYVPLYQPNSDESKEAFKQIDETLPSMSIIGFLEREMRKTRITPGKTKAPHAAHTPHAAHAAHTPHAAHAAHTPHAAHAAHTPHAAHAALTPLAAHAALTPHTPHTATRRYPKILKDSDDDYDSDGSFQDGDDSREDNEARGSQKRPAAAISTLDDTPTIAGYFAAIAPVPSNFSSKSSNALLAAFDPSNNAISADLVQKSNKKLRGSKEQDIKDLRVVAKDAWSKAIGLSDEKKVAPSWKKVFTKTKYRDGHVYGLVGWPEDLPYPKTNRKGKVDHDIEGLSTDDAKRVLKGFRDGVIDFKRLN